MLRIERIAVSILHVPIDDVVPMSFGRLEGRQSCIVEVESGGLTGIGESWINYPSWAPSERVATVMEGVAPLVLGADVDHPRTFLDELARVLVPIGRQWGALGPIWQALSGVDIALWDLFARARGVSVGRALADDAAQSLRSHIPGYASGVGPDDVVNLTEKALTLGFGAVKAKLGFGADTDIATVQAVRSVAGSDVDLFVDANQAWTLDEATSMIPTLTDHGVAWLEEPLAGDRLADLEKLALAGDIHLATGENLYGMDAFAAYGHSPAVSILQPDLAKCGGLTMGDRVTGQDQHHRIAPHCYSSAIGLAAGAHLGAARANVEWLEVDVRPNPLRTDLFEQPLEWEGGAIRVPEGPGLGVVLDREVVGRYCIRHEELTI